MGWEIPATWIGIVVLSVEEEPGARFDVAAQRFVITLVVALSYRQKLLTKLHTISTISKILIYYFLVFVSSPLVDNVEVEESKSLFETNYSHVYFILYDTFIQAEANLKQKGN